MEPVLTQPATGTAAFSEPEAKNVKWVLDTFSSVRWFADLHSFGADVLYSWGSDEDQSDFPKQTFLNSSYDSVRGILSDTPGHGNGYGEYTPKSEHAANLATAQRMSAAMRNVGGRIYRAIPAVDLYPTSGASDDYSYSRHFANTTLNLVHAYTIEMGHASGLRCPFYPTVAEYNENLREVAAGFMETLLAAVELDLGPRGCGTVAQV